MQLQSVKIVPDWIQRFSDAIDELDFSRGFERVKEDTAWSFGTAQGNGASQLEAFFRKIDGPLVTRHQLLECWTGPDCHIVRGEAQVAAKDGSHSTVNVPFVWIFYVDAERDDRLERIYIVNGPVKTDAVL